jgi:hypothetical protein
MSMANFAAVIAQSEQANSRIPFSSRIRRIYLEAALKHEVRTMLSPEVWSCRENKFSSLTPDSASWNRFFMNLTLKRGNFIKSRITTSQSNHRFAPCIRLMMLLL